MKYLEYIKVLQLTVSDKTNIKNLCCAKRNLVISYSR